jgi:hypothetical protein
MLSAASGFAPCDATLAIECGTSVAWHGGAFATADQCYDASDTEPTAQRRGHRNRSERVAETNLDDIRHR